MKNINGAEILITGGAGFIGSTLAQRLVEDGAKVTIIDAMIEPYGGNMFNLKSIIKKVKFIEEDVRSIDDVKKAVDGKDFIFHLAGQTGRSISMQDPILDTQINVLGTLNVLNVIRNQKRKSKILFASSRGVIGKPIYLPVDEKHPENPRDVYGINKLTAERDCILFGKEYGFGVTALRLNNVYGPRCQIRSNHYGTVNLFIAYALKKKILPIFGNGKQTRDYVFIDDVVDAFIKATDSKADGEIFFVGTGRETSLLEIVSTIKEFVPGTQYEHVPFPEILKSVDFPKFYSTSKKIEKILGWKPKVDISEGIGKTTAFYEENLKSYL